MILHIFPVGMFTKDYISFIKENFDTNEHCFVKPLNANKAMGDIYHLDLFDSYANCVNILSFDFLSKLKKCNGILVHGMFGLKQPLLFNILPGLCKKANWLIWGGDLYGSQEQRKGFKKKFGELLKRHAVKKFQFITTLNKRDYKYAKQWYHVKGENLLATYPVSSMLELEKINLIPKRPDEPLKIIIGNSATSTNQHEEALSILSKFKEENIEIYLPLSYGFGDFHAYGEKIVTYATKIFWDKVRPIYKCIDAGEYTNLLQHMDIGIYNNNRQQAMGNIQQMVWFGKKVYMRTDTSMWENCRDDREFILNDISMIPNQSFDDFKYYNPQIQKINMQNARKYHSLERYLKVWGNIFEKMSQ